MKDGPAGAARVQANLLAAGERRLLTWLCRHMPRPIQSDHLTAIGFLGALAVLGGYAFSRASVGWLWLAIAGYAINWFGDSLDGSLARYRGNERPRFGHFLDHSLDALANMLGMIGLGLTRFVSMDFALFTLVAYLLLTIHVLLRLRATQAMQLSFAGGGPTELRLGLVALTGAMLIFGRDFAPLGIPFYDAVTAATGAALLGLFLWHTGAVAALLRREEG